MARNIQTVVHQIVIDEKTAKNKVKKSTTLKELFSFAQALKTDISRLCRVRHRRFRTCDGELSPLHPQSGNKVTPEGTLQGILRYRQLLLEL
ncbi:hypothetical protein [Cellvibrio mixtus]|uniref:hypothetical protein n=1 Tax=Cellvibrio mixtus TaxID=39650 RepID=UPI00126A1B9D|nr:hypothetical protein [Cellvibrio mixtus]